MNNKTSMFNLIMLGVFFLFAAIGFVLFATYQGGAKDGAVVGEVVIWGTIDQQIMDNVIMEAKKENISLRNVIYVEQDKATYKTDLLEELAAGNAPDLLLVSNENFYFNLNKIYKIPNEQYSVRGYISTFVDAFNIFIDADGVYAIPFVIDPMVMYYNKNIFISNSIATPPKHWEDFVDLSKILTIIDDKDNVKRSTISFGVVSNVENFKEILINLFLQLGNEIVVKKGEGFETYKDFINNKKSPIPAIRFFMEFSNQTSPAYSWNKSLPNSKQFFLGGKLATYFGFCSEISDIRRKNPNLIFDVAEMPTVAGATRKSVFSKVYGLAIPKGSKNKHGAFVVATEFASPTVQKIISKKFNLPTTRRALLVEPAADIYMDIFNKEAIYAQSMVDPDAEKTYDIFKFMIESIYGGKYTPQKSVMNAMKEMDLLFEK